MWKPNYCAVEPTPVGRAEFSFFFIFWRRARNAQRNQQHRECSSSSTQYAWGVYFSLSSLRLFIIIPSSSLYFFPSLFASPLFFFARQRERLPAHAAFSASYIIKLDHRLVNTTPSRFYMPAAFLSNRFQVETRQINNNKSKWISVFFQRRQVHGQRARSTGRVVFHGREKQNETTKKKSITLDLLPPSLIEIATQTKRTAGK